MLQHRLLLWEIDGVLLAPAQATHDAFVQAAATYLHVSVDEISASLRALQDPTRTVRGCIEALAMELGATPDEVRVPAHQVAHLCGRLFAEHREEFRTQSSVCAGVRSLLCALDESLALQALCTTHLAPVAVEMLTSFRLDVHFDAEVGAYGDDGTHMAELVDVALTRVERRRGLEIANDNVWLVGSSSATAAVAEACGVRCLLVRSGLPVQLGMADSTPLPANTSAHVVENLEDTEGIAKVLLSA